MERQGHDGVDTVGIAEKETEVVNDLPNMVSTEKEITEEINLFINNNILRHQSFCPENHNDLKTRFGR